MGVPALFRWLNEKYPKITSQVIEQEDESPDASSSNPNGIEFDNLYLDMNGIIHPCCHPEGKKAPENENEMFLEIFRYIDRLFHMIRPRKLLYMAIDGVAPRAKMNQQRSRRFRSSQESKLTQESKEKSMALLLQVPDENVGTSIDDMKLSFDSNCITPGTKFMHDLSLALNYYIIDKINTDSGWSNIRVILSDSSVPGEGEHKIMEFIRKQRASLQHDPNTQHVIYGLDADLIMLSLATHEPHFRVLREDVFHKKPSNIDSTSSISLAESTNSTESQSSKPPFIFLDISILREYLYYEFSHNFTSNFDFERMIDDWIFLCFFVGNDFLPHLPSLEIREGAIDLLLDTYKKCFHLFNKNLYISNQGLIDISNVKILLDELGIVEDEIFKKRHERELKREEIKNQRIDTSDQKSNVPRYTAKRNIAIDLSLIPLGEDSNIKRKKIESGARSLEENQGIADQLRQYIDNGSENKNESKDDDQDNIRLWEQGSKERYYKSKLNTSVDDHSFIQKMIHSYIEGVCWVMAYYYRGCVSWNWFYPYHYAPFASDFIHIDKKFKPEFQLGHPFKPFEQLLGVLPPQSHQLLPKPYHSLLLDKNSELNDFYPDNFVIDLNGKKHPWQGVALLSFIDENRLVETARKIEPLLSNEDSELNEFGQDIFYVSKYVDIYEVICSLYTKARNEKIKLDGPVDGFIIPLKGHDICIPNGIFHPPLFMQAILPDITDNICMQSWYILPDTSIDSFPPKLLHGVRLAKSVVRLEDFLKSKSQKENRDRHSWSRGSNGGYHSMRQEYHSRLTERSELPWTAYRNNLSRSSSSQEPKAYRDKNSYYMSNKR